MSEETKRTTALKPARVEKSATVAPKPIERKVAPKPAPLPEVKRPVRRRTKQERSPETIYNEVCELFETFKHNHYKSSTENNKAAALRARKASREIPGLLLEYRKSSINKTKS
jgi:hypothetical protein